MKKLTIRAWTDYPFVELGDIPGEEAPVREVRVVGFDRDKYLLVEVLGNDEVLPQLVTTVKWGYVYNSPNRGGNPVILHTTEQRQLSKQYVSWLETLDQRAPL